MKTYLDCIPCFFRQLLDGARRIGASQKVQKQVLDEFAKIIPELSLKASPPEIAQIGYSMLKKISANMDPYKKIKVKSNRLAMALRDNLVRKLVHSEDRLLTALELAIAGNIIDFGVKNNINIDEELKKILAKEKRFVHKNSIFHYQEFKETLSKSKDILYLADNAGEIVFDQLFIEEIKRQYPGKNIQVAVKEKPVINDALREDAEFCDMGKVARIISNGADAPGTVLHLCSDGFKKIFRDADMVISKGQGNFESLSFQSK